MYLLTICVVLWPVIAIIFLSSAPDSAVEVAKPDLKLCPAYLLPSRPAKLAYFLIINATLLSEIGKILPFFVFPLASQSCKCNTGQ